MAVVLCFDDAYGQPRQEIVVVGDASNSQRQRQDEGDEANNNKDDTKKGSTILTRSSASCSSIVDATESILRRQQSYPDIRNHVIPQSAHNYNSSSRQQQLLHSHQQLPSQQPPSQLPRRRRLLVREFSVSDSHLQEEDLKSLVEVLLSASSSSSPNATAAISSTNNDRIQSLDVQKKTKKKTSIAGGNTTTTIIPNINRRSSSKSLSRKSSSSASLQAKKSSPTTILEASALTSAASCPCLPNQQQQEQSSSSSAGSRQPLIAATTAAATDTADVDVNVNCALERLSLTNNGLTCTSSTTLARIVTYTSQTLQELDLSNNQVKAPGLEILVQALTRSTTSSSSTTGTRLPNDDSSNNTCCCLQKLNLFNNRLGSPAAKAIAHLLRYNSSIIDLRLGKNSLKSSKCIQIIAAALLENSVLQHLDLSFNGIGNASAKVLAHVLDPRSSYSYSSSSSHDHYTTCKNKCRLKSLDFQHNGITDSAVAELAATLVDGPNTTLQILNLSTNNLSLEGARAMAFVYQYSYTLRELILSGCNIGDAGVHLLCVGWKQQESGCVLHHLDVSWNLIHDEGAIELAASMLAGPDAILTKLNLASNGIANDGACAIAQALVSRGSARSLRELNLINNQIGDVGAAALANAIASPQCPELFVVQSLQWQENKHMTATGKTRIQRAFLFRQHYQTWLQHDVLSRVEHTERFNLQLFAKRNVMGDDELLCICHYISKYQRQIPYLSLQGPHMTQRGIQALCEQVVGGVRTMTTATVSDKKSLNGTKGGDDHRHHYGVVNDACVKGPLVERLYMQSVPGFGDVDASLVVQAIMKPSCALTVLSLVDCNISCHGATELARAIWSLRELSPLNRLNLNNNNIGDDGAVALLTAVRFLPMHRQLPTVDDEHGNGAQEPSNNVVCNITALSLACNNITDASLCPAIATTTTNHRICSLEELDLSGNAITDRGALDLAKTCMDLERLRWLTVSSNIMTGRGVQVLNLYLPVVCSLVADGQRS